MAEIFTEEHREYINKQITKALKTVDYGQIVKNAIEREFEALYEECKLKQSLEDIVTQVIYEHLVKSGLLKDDKDGE